MIDDNNHCVVPPFEFCSLRQETLRPENTAVLDNRISAAVQEDVELVRRCLTGEQQAWEELYDKCHLRLLRWIRFLLSDRGRDSDLVEEIAARVWFVLVRDDAELLARYDGDRNTHLFVFVHAIARYQTLMFLRSERRRRNRETQQGVRLEDAPRLSECEISAILKDFITTLTRGERQFLEQSLLTGGEEDPNPLGLTDTTIWQRRHGIRKKVHAFFG